MEIFLNYIDKGGIIFSFLAFLSLIAITIIIYKSLEIFVFRSLDFSKILDELDNDINLNDLKDKIINKSSNSKKSFLKKILKILEKNKPKDYSEQEINRLVENEFRKIQLFMPSLEIIAQVSPLIGLLGTVIGMIDSFNELELGGSLVDPSILAGGIWTALLTTAMGLIVAIPALVSHYFFEKKIQNLYNNLDSLIKKFSMMN